MSRISSTATSLSLLEALLDPTDARAWQRVDGLYRPMVTEFAIQLGLNSENAAEVAQRVAVALFESYRRGRYDRSRGRFKNWLLGIARHEIADYCAEQARQPTTPADRSDIEARLDLIRDPNRLSSAWDRQWERHVLTICLVRAAQQFSDRDIKIFKMLALEARSPAQIAEEMGLTSSNVTTIKHRVLGYIKECREQIELEG